MRRSFLLAADLLAGDDVVGEAYEVGIQAYG